ncbi:hypothetical protein KS4_35290 [Poriferisphaera corsica]|uniref:Uncharacterized protein n=1 Tax=Poriferisphaera corsica TaxID=2528020 RepID=A0A517YZ11_9BACT|nr:hypothetical protein KS4_35290 [Poriferisphaera corsica]
MIHFDGTELQPRNALASMDTKLYSRITEKVQRMHDSEGNQGRQRCLERFVWLFVC